MNANSRLELNVKVTSWWSSSVSHWSIDLQMNARANLASKWTSFYVFQTVSIFHRFVPWFSSFLSDSGSDSSILWEASENWASIAFGNHQTTARAWQNVNRISGILASQFNSSSIPRAVKNLIKTLKNLLLSSSSSSSFFYIFFWVVVDVVYNQWRIERIWLKFQQNLQKILSESQCLFMTMEEVHYKNFMARSC